MDLNVYEIIRGPWVTSKAYTLNQVLKQLVLEVHPNANKIMIAYALKVLFNVRAENICISIRKGKARRSGRYMTVGKKRKKAIVTLQPGQSIDLNDWNTIAVEQPNKMS